MKRIHNLRNNFNILNNRQDCKFVFNFGIISNYYLYYATFKLYLKMNEANGYSLLC